MLRTLLSALLLVAFFCSEAAAQGITVTRIPNANGTIDVQGAKYLTGRRARRGNPTAAPLEFGALMFTAQNGADNTDQVWVIEDGGNFVDNGHAWTSVEAPGAQVTIPLTSVGGTTDVSVYVDVFHLNGTLDYALSAGGMTETLTVSEMQTSLWRIDVTIAADTSFVMAAQGGLQYAAFSVAVVTASGGPVMANTAPVTDAGPSQTINLPNQTATLTGTAQDDGLPNPPGALSYGWSQLSGPGASTIVAPTQLMTDVMLPTTGMYVFELTVSDGDLSAADTVVVALAQTGDTDAGTVDSGTGVRDSGTGVRDGGPGTSGRDSGVSNPSRDGGASVTPDSGSEFDSTSGCNCRTDQGVARSPSAGWFTLLTFLVVCRRRRVHDSSRGRTRPHRLRNPR